MVMVIGWRQRLDQKMSCVTKVAKDLQTVYKVRSPTPVTPSRIPSSLDHFHCSHNFPSLEHHFTNIKHISFTTMSDNMYCSPSGQVFEYGQIYPSSFNSRQSWTPINMTQVDYNNPPDPSSYMYGEQFGNCFIHEDNRGSLFGRVLRAIFCLS